MTISARLTAWYSAVLLLSLVLLGGGLYYELVVERRAERLAGRPRETVEEEIREILFYYAVPALVVTFAGGWWLTRRALSPVSDLTRAIERISARNLGEHLPRSGNGDELDRLTGICNEMLGRLGRSFTQEREFTLHASHELKTPLTIMRGQIETALREEILTEVQREFMAGYIDEIERLAAIVDSLALLARADAGIANLRPGPIRLDELVRDAHEDARLLGSARALEVILECTPAVEVRGDRHRLRQLLLAITDNAIQYNHPGGHIRFRLEAGAGLARLEVSNTGPGIPPEKLPRVFDRFYRGDPAHGSDGGGCGLGLSVARTIVAAHAGTITIESQPGGETRVAIGLPLVD